MSTAEMIHLHHHHHQQPLNLALPSKTKAKMAARAIAAQEAAELARMNNDHLHHHHHHHHDHHHHHQTNCHCPEIDSKSSILYRLLTGSDSYKPISQQTTELHDCTMTGRCGCGSPTQQMESKLKLLLEATKKDRQMEVRVQ